MTDISFAAAIHQLPQRAQKVVAILSPSTPEELAEADLLRVPNCGRKTENDIREWLARNFGVEVPPRSSPLHHPATLARLKRYVDVLDLRSSGVSAQEIADRGGITVGRVNQILRRARALERNGRLRERT